MTPHAKHTERLVDLLSGHRVTAALGAAVNLGLIEALASGPSTTSEIAAECHTHAASTARLLNALVQLDICRPALGGRYALTELGALLTMHADPPLRDWAVFEASMLAPAWLGIGDSIRSGKTAGELAHQTGGRYAHLDRDPALASLFDAAMTNMSRLVARDMLAAYDFRSAGRILDVGGGSGALLVEILRACPTTTGTILDLARCEPAAGAAIRQADLTARAEFQAGDFFVDVPTGFDTLILKSVLHNWDDARCAMLLENCHGALGGSGRIVVVERLAERSPDDPHRRVATALSDLNMLRGPGGRERSESAYRALAANAGLAVVEVRDAGRYALLVCAPLQRRPS
jgi:SAM-dependent methyltransferase